MKGTTMCRNHWLGAGHREGRRSATVVQDAGQKPRDNLMVEQTSRWNIELYTTPKSQRGRSSVGVDCRPLSRVVCFFEYRLNRTPNSEKVSVGVFTLWVAVVVFVSAGPGTQRVSDAATGHPVYSLRVYIEFYRASFIRWVVHFVRCCPSTGDKTCEPKANDAR